MRNRQSTSGSLGALADGSKVAIIGGGPGGSAAGIALKELARAQGKSISVNIIENKQFIKEQHHNQCAGVLSPPIADLFSNLLHLPFPYHLDHCLIYGYILHANGRQIVLDGETEPSVALRRVQFDAYMLQSANARGVGVIPARATGLEFHGDRVVVYTENAPLEVDVVIGAFGLDEGTGMLFTHAVGYKPPPALSSIVTKYHPGEDGIAQFGKRIHAFLPASSRIEFGAVTPKTNHLTINIAGKSVDANLMRTFLSNPDVGNVLPAFDTAGRLNPLDLRFYKGRFPCGLAANYTGDRFVMIGDAAGLVRAFKGKGITSAMQTGIRAADVLMNHGISAMAFSAFHTANRDITLDMPVGQVMRFQTILASRLGLMGVVLRAAENEPGLRRALFDAVSAHHSYAQVVREGLTFSAVRAILGAMIRFGRV